MTTLSSEFLAQSTIPFRPFMGKLISVITDTAGSLWMLATMENFKDHKFTKDSKFAINNQASTNVTQLQTITFASSCSIIGKMKGLYE